MTLFQVADKVDHFIKYEDINQEESEDEEASSSKSNNGSQDVEMKD